MPDPKITGTTPTQDFISKYLVDMPVEAVKGLLGLEPTDPSDIGKAISQRSVGTNTNLLMQALGAAIPLAKAGLPFAALTGNKPVFHGTQSAFENFNPNLAKGSSLFTGMVHGTEDPYLADLYAKGSLMANKYSTAKSNGIGQNIVPITSDAKNVLDLTQKLSNEDLEKAFASVPEQDRIKLKKLWQIYRNNPTKDNQELLNHTLLGELDYPSSLDALPFDAIKYDVANAHNSYAFQPTTLLKTPWGTNLTPKSTNPTFLSSPSGIEKVRQR